MTLPGPRYAPAAMRVTGRLAPTPSGHLHLGNALAFAAAWLSARAQHGTLLLRIEDLEAVARGAARVSLDAGTARALEAGRAAMHDEQLAYGLQGSDGARPSLASVRCSLRRGGFFSSVALISSISSRTRTAASAETAARWTVTGSGEGRWNLQ